MLELLYGDEMLYQQKNLTHEADTDTDVDDDVSVFARNFARTLMYARACIKTSTSVYNPLWKWTTTKG
jgi:hypothetical protein